VGRVGLAAIAVCNRSPRSLAGGGWEYGRSLRPLWRDEEQFIVRFDPDTGLITMFESMRYKGETAVGKTLWINEAIQWGELDGRIVLLEAALTWYDDGSPWASFVVEELVYNADITTISGQPDHKDLLGLHGQPVGASWHGSRLPAT
jgi:hypothetical protein